MVDQARVCFHCTSPLPSVDQFQLEVSGKVESFCCPACRAVAQTILNSGLDKYYDHRNAPAVDPKTNTSVSAELSLYDSPEVQKEFVRKLTAERSEANLVIEGISCAACVWLLEKHIGALPGVDRFSVNLTNHRAHLTWNPQQTQLSELFKQIIAIGYTPHPYHPNREEQLYQEEHKRAVRRLGVAGVGMMQVMMMAMALYLGQGLTMEPHIERFIRWTSLIVATPVVLYAARPFFIAALRDLKTRHLSMDVPVSIAIGGAYIASVWATIFGGGEVYFDSVSMFTFFLLIGRFFEMQARHRTGLAGNALANLLPASAIKLEEGQEVLVPVAELKAGDRVLVKPGHSIPADSILLSESASIDESALTGEPLPVTRNKGDALTGGTLNVDQPIELEVSATSDQGRMSAILNLLDRAQADKPAVARVADKVASYFVGAVLVTAIVVGFSWYTIRPEDALWIVLSVLVVTCPCALSLATPTALTAAIGSLRQMGLLITRGHVLESLAQADTVAFDKTGTLTTGKLSIRKIVPLNGTPEAECLEIAAALESRSEHPIASAFSPYFRYPPQQARTQVGAGIEGELNRRVLRIGKPAYAAQLFLGEPPDLPDNSGLCLLLASAEGPICWFVIDDQIRPEANEAISALKQLNLQLVMLTGDNRNNGQRVAASLGIDSVEAEMTPEAKLAWVSQQQEAGRRILMVGDGINDIPVLSGAQTSVAMNEATDLAKTSADAVLMSGDLRKLAVAIAQARRTRAIIKQNIAWSLSYNLIALPLAALGFIAPWMAAIGMSASSLVVVGNALRLTRNPREL
ncbi:MAG TPA: heavy metal translocating P-type ATPase [Marinobacterium sp.]|nr:heavy metal translocating P-type ATPase [Marinobacterium sp.]